jgi:hypothetical protein
MADEADEVEKKSGIGCKTWALLIVLVLALITWLVVYAANRVLSLRMNATHSYSLPSPPRFLTDAQATIKATQALNSEGYSSNLWKPVELSKSRDPDGNPDKCFQRDPKNPAKGIVTFADSDQASAKNSRIVHVELKGNQIECRVEMPH